MAFMTVQAGQIDCSDDLLTREQHTEQYEAEPVGFFHRCRYEWFPLLNKTFFPFRQKLNHFRCANEILSDRKMSPNGAFLYFEDGFARLFLLREKTKKKITLKRGLSHTLLSPFSHFFLSFATFFVSKPFIKTLKPSPDSKQKRLTKESPDFLRPQVHPRGDSKENPLFRGVTFHCSLCETIVSNE